MSADWSFIEEDVDSRGVLMDLIVRAKKAVDDRVT